MSDENRPGRRQPPDGGQAGRNGAAPPDAVLHPVDSHTLRRAGILWFVMIAAFVYLLVRILILQTGGYEKYQNKVLSQLTTESSVTAERGRIYDTNRTVLATNVTTYRVFISPRTIREYSEEDGTRYDEIIANGLSGLLDTTYENVMKQTTYTRYLDRTIARQVDEQTAAQVEEFIDKYRLNNMVFLQAGSKRYYPYGHAGVPCAGLYHQRRRRCLRAGTAVRQPAFRHKRTLHHGAGLARQRNALRVPKLHPRQRRALPSSRRWTFMSNRFWRSSSLPPTLSRADRTAPAVS